MSQRSAAADGSPGSRGWSRLVALDVTPGRFFEGRDVAGRIAPFVVAGALPLALLPFVGASFTDPRVLIAAAMVPVIIALALGFPWSGHPAWPQAILPLAYFVIVALLRDASVESPSIFAPLVILPVTWFALYGTGRELAISIVVMSATLILPVILIGGSAYAHNEIERGIVAIVLASTLGPVVHLLVGAMQRMNRNLGEAEERFRRAFDDNRVGMALVSTSGHYQRVNRALCKITGYPAGRAARQDLQRDHAPRRRRRGSGCTQRHPRGGALRLPHGEALHPRGRPSGLDLPERLPGLRVDRRGQLPDRPGRGHLRAQGLGGAPHPPGAP